MLLTTGKTVVMDYYFKSMCYIFTIISTIVSLISISTLVNCEPEDGAQLTFITINSTAISHDLSETRRAINVTQHLIRLEFKYKLLFSSNEDEDLCLNFNTFSNYPEFVNDLPCINSIQAFDYQKYGSRQNSPINYCKSMILLTEPLTLIENTTYIFGNLLPYQLYSFSSELIGMYSDEVVHPMLISTPTGYNCTAKSKPLYPPQTDLGSFMTLSVKNKSEESVAIGLYWQIVPKLFRGSIEANYIVRCYETEMLTIDQNSQLVLERTDANKKHGSITIHLKNTELYNHVCEISTNNSLGSSDNSSIIAIPKEENILKTNNNLLINAILEEDGKHFFKWIDIRSVVEAEDDDDDLSEGFYTIYWCLSVNNTCNGIDGMIETSKTTNITLEIKRKFAEPNIFKFGLSYKNKNSTKFTGIHWNPCLTFNKRQILELEIAIDHAKSRQDHTSLDMQWNFDTCKSMVLFVVQYNITYCHLGPVKPCLTNIEKARLPVVDVDFENSHNCRFMVIGNQTLIKNATLKGLIPSSRYALRIGYKTFYDSRSTWSKTFNAYTDSNPDDCSSRPFYVIILTCLICFMLFIVMYKRANSCLILIRKFKNASTTLPIRLDDILNQEDEVSQSGLQYWIKQDQTTTTDLNSQDEFDSTLYEYRINSETNIITRVNKVYTNGPSDDNQIISDDDNNYDNNINSDYVSSKNMLKQDLNQHMISKEEDYSELVRPRQETDLIQNYDNYSTNSDELSSSAESSFIDNIMSEIIQAKKPN